LAYNAPAISLAISPSTYVLFNQDNTFNSNNVTTTVNLNGRYATKAPTGTVRLTNVLTGNTTTVAVIPSEGTTSISSISWNPNTLGISTTGNYTFRVNYLGDDWNNVTSATQTISITKPTPSISLSYISTASNFVGYPLSFTVTKSSDTVMTAPVTLRNITDNITIGTGTFVGNIVTFELPTTATFTNKVFRAIYPETGFHNSTVTNPLTISVTKENPNITFTFTSTQSLWVGYPAQAIATRNNARAFAGNGTFEIYGSVPGMSPSQFLISTSTAIWVGNTATVTIDNIKLNEMSSLSISYADLYPNNLTVVIRQPEDSNYINYSTLANVVLVKPTPSILKFDLVAAHIPWPSSTNSFAFETAPLYDVSTSGSVTSLTVHPGTTLGFDIERNLIGLPYYVKRLIGQLGAPANIAAKFQYTDGRPYSLTTDRGFLPATWQYPNSWREVNKYLGTVTNATLIPGRQLGEPLYDNFFETDNQARTEFTTATQIRYVDQGGLVRYDNNLPYVLTYETVTAPDGTTGTSQVYTYTRAQTPNAASVFSAPAVGETVIYGTEYGNRYSGDLTVYTTEGAYHSIATTSTAYRIFVKQVSYNDDEWAYSGIQNNGGARTPMSASYQTENTGTQINFSWSLGGQVIGINRNAQPYNILSIGGVFVVRDSNGLVKATVSVADHSNPDGPGIGTINAELNGKTALRFPASGNGDYTVVWYPDSTDYTKNDYPVAISGVIVYSGGSSSTAPYTGL
jgi:hypothetical protein